MEEPIRIYKGANRGSYFFFVRLVDLVTCIEIPMIKMNSIERLKIVSHFGVRKNPKGIYESKLSSLISIISLAHWSRPNCIT